MFAALFQEQGVIQFASARFSPAQIQFTPSHKLVLAVHWAVQHFKLYLLFVKFELYVGDAAT